MMASKQIQSIDGKFTNAQMHLSDSRPWSSWCAEKPTSWHFVHQEYIL